MRKTQRTFTGQTLDIEAIGQDLKCPLKCPTQEEWTFAEYQAVTPYLARDI